jgi:hypothetical protein
MGVFVAPFVLVRALIWTAVLVLSVAVRHPKPAIVVIAVLFIATGGRW